MFNAIFGIGNFVVNLLKLAFAAIGARIFTDTTNELVMRSGMPVLGFIKSIIGNIAGIFKGFLGFGWAGAEEQVAA